MTKRAAAVGLLVLLLAAAGWLLFEGKAPWLEKRGAGVPPDRGDAAAPAPASAGTNEAEPDVAATRAIEEEPGPTDEEIRRAEDAAAVPPAKPVLLHVVDAVRRFELQRCEVREVRDFMRGTSGVIRLEDLKVVSRGDSPLKLEPSAKRRWTQLVVARAEGYAPANASIDWRAGGDQEIALRRGSTLELRLIGRPEGSTAGVALYRTESLRPWIERRQETLRDWDELQPRRRTRERARLERAFAHLAGPFATGELSDPELLASLRACQPQRELALSAGEITTIDGLEPGTWCAVVLEPQNPEPAAAGAIEITDAPLFRLELPWHVREAAKKVEVTGRLIVHPAWFADASPPETCSFEVAWAGEPSSIDLAYRIGSSIVTVRAVADAPSCTYAFSFKSMPGPWLARLVDGRAILPIDVPAEGVRDLELRVAAPAEVELTLVDGRTGQPASSAKVRFQPAAAREAFPLQAVRLARAEDGCFRFLAQVGELDLWITDDSGPVSKTIDLVAGRNEFRIELVPNAILDVVLKDGNRAIPWSIDHHFVLVRGGERRMAVSMNLGGDQSPEATLCFDVSGRWFVSLREIDGYAPVDPIPVDLIAGRTVKIEIPLKREKRVGGEAR